VEIAKLHRELGATTIYVTHDQVEAMTLAHRVVVLRDAGSSKWAPRGDTMPTANLSRQSSAPRK